MSPLYSPNTAAVIRALASSLGLSVSPFSSNIRDQTRRVGGVSAAEAFAYYIRNMEELSGDKRLTEFMDFYAKNWNRSCSQWSQDIFVMFITGLKREGAFLEIGGADGFTHSNTYYLEKILGWQGTLVEPDPSQFHVLSRARKGSNLIRAAIVAGNTSRKYRLRTLGQLSAIEGYEGKDTHHGARLSTRATTPVKAISISELLLETKYDYLSLDIEGAELTILRAIDWESVNRPRVITVEHNFRHHDRELLAELLMEQGYVEHFEKYDWLRRGDIWASLPD